MSKTETLLLFLSLACNIYLLCAHYYHRWAVDKFNKMQIELNDALSKSVEIIFKLLK